MGNQVISRLPWENELHRCLPKQQQYVAAPWPNEHTIKVTCKGCLKCWEHPDGREFYHYYKMGYAAASKSFSGLVEQMAIKVVGL